MSHELSKTPGVKIGGINVMCNEYLPPGWMVCSPDIYKLLTATDETNKAEQDRLLKASKAFSELVDRMGKK